MVTVLKMTQRPGRNDHFRDPEQVTAKDAVELLVKKEIACGGVVSAISRNGSCVDVEVIRSNNGGNMEKTVLSGSSREMREVLDICSFFIRRLNDCDTKSQSLR